MYAYCIIQAYLFERLSKNFVNTLIKAGANITVLDVMPLYIVQLVQSNCGIEFKFSGNFKTLHI